MRDHPLTPMADPNLVRVLQAQTSRTVGLVRHDMIEMGCDRVVDSFDSLTAAGVGIAIVDAIANADLDVIGEACADVLLVTGGSGLASGLAHAYAARGWIAADGAAAHLDKVAGRAAVISGSCSFATNAQVEAWVEESRPSFQVDPCLLADGSLTVDEIVTWGRLARSDRTGARVRDGAARCGPRRAGEAGNRTGQQTHRNKLGRGGPPTRRRGCNEGDRGRWRDGWSCCSGARSRTFADRRDDFIRRSLDTGCRSSTPAGPQVR